MMSGLLTAKDKENLHLTHLDPQLSYPMRMSSQLSGFA